MCSRLFTIHSGRALLLNYVVSASIRSLLFVLALVNAMGMCLACRFAKARGFGELRIQVRNAAKRHSTMADETGILFAA